MNLPFGRIPNMKIKVGLLCLSLFASFNSWAKEVTISTFEHDTPQLDTSIYVMKSIYQRIGYDMKIIRFPGKRSIVEANLGSVNGELVRVKNIETQATNLIRIPYAIGSLKAMAITRTGQAKVVGMAGLIDKRVGILRGVELSERITKNLDRQILNSIESLFSILLSGRVDLILFPELDALEYIKIHKLEGKVIISDNPIVAVPLYHFVHKDSKRLADQLTAEMKEMKQGGELKELIKAAETQR